MPPGPAEPRPHPFARRVADALRRRCGAREADALLLAVSGGADSVALLRALAPLAHARSWRLRLAVAHVHHGVRAEADADATATADLARSLGLDCDRLELDPARLQGNPEAAMRRARYALLADAARRRGAALVTAHHADDQLETVLMRLIRGASARGLAGMAWRARTPDPAGGPPVPLLRPMLAVTAADARAFLRDLRQPWRDDATNLDATRWRARLRRDVLPVLRDLRPAAARRAVALGEHLRAVDRVIAAHAAALLAGATRSPDAITLDRAALRAAPRAVSDAAIRLALRDAGADADRLGARALAPISRAARDRRGGERAFRPAGVPVTLSHAFVRITRKR